MSDEIAVQKIKRGYLKEDFRFFHLRDKKDIEFEFHYHDFHKIIIFISGTVTYLIEGKAYKLKPWDFLLVSSSDMHRAIIDSDASYERIIIWVNSRFMELHNNDCNLETCFELASQNKNNLLRLNQDSLKEIKPTLFLLENSVKDKDFGNNVLKNCLFIQFIVHLNRLFLGKKTDKTENDINYDPLIGDVIDHINLNLGEELSLEKLSSEFYISRYYLMHKFKAQTGYTVHNYIQQKRLIKAAFFIRSGSQIIEACSESGFGDYSNFERAFKKQFGLSPKKYYKTMMDLEKSYIQGRHL